MKQIFVFLWACFVVVLLSVSVEAQDFSESPLYQKIFELQNKGEYKRALQLSEEIQNPTLMGYVLYQHYFFSNHKTKKSEILQWLKNYSDYPIAGEMYALGVQKKVSPLPRPKGIFGGNTHACEHIVRFEPSDLIRSLSFSHITKTAERKKAQKQMRQFKRYLFRGSTLNAKNLLNQKEVQKLWGKKISNYARISLAFSYFLDNRNDLAQVELNKILSGNTHPFAYWLQGIVLWQQNKPEQGAAFFEKATQTSKEPSLKTSSAFWTARSFMRSGQYDKVGDYLEIASKYPRYFYSFLSSRMLGENLTHNWEEPQKIENIENSEYTSDGLERFYMLDRIGYKKWASEELTQLYLNSDEEERCALWKIAEDHSYGSVLKNLTGRLDGEESRFPLPDWTPETDWKLDKTLVYAFVRQESCFNVRAESNVGAVGLMQLMPSTAKELAQSLQCDYSVKKLKNPEYNLALGQHYLTRLLDSQQIQGNLMKLAVAYNAGPGNLNKWEKKMDYKEDPLLFLEKIPSRETRTFVERILINYWVYSSLLGESLDSLDSLIEGKWPYYQMCSS